MLNFSNLNDWEFEALCRDVMSRMLGYNLQFFSPGRDGGIDLTEDAYRRTIIVQVKHYAQSGFSALRASLKAEVPKVKKQNPSAYYVCCSTKLTPDNKRDIYLLFSDYMSSTSNVISLIEIDDFLQDAVNADILRKHYKLWLSSTNVLAELLTGDIGIDSEILAVDIEHDIKRFVHTAAFDAALACLDQSNAVIITGNPGSGKTITSKMLVLHYAAQGYRIRFTSAFADLSALKRALSQNPDGKEIILLDDCFGQAYFKMKESQGTELTYLIKYVNVHPNKKLLMNSRVSIFQEVQHLFPELAKCLDTRLFKTYVLNMDDLSYVEKAKIFYNHLYFCNLPQEYLANIRQNKNYRDIVKHKNYNPRIMEFVCNPKHWSNIASDNYSTFVLQCLSNPEQIWREEYERRLHLADRILLTTLFSLTDGCIPLEFVRKCYNFRVNMTPVLDTSVDHFDQALLHLSGSMIKVVDFGGYMHLTVANPSVNDFIRSYLKHNETERQAILKTSCSVHQWFGIADKDTYIAKVKASFADKSILNAIFESAAQKDDFIVYGCAEGFAFDGVYKPYIEKFLRCVHDVDTCQGHRVNTAVILNGLFTGTVCDYYHLDCFIQDSLSLLLIMEHLDVYDLVGFLMRVEKFFVGAARITFLELVKPKLEEEISLYCTDVPADTYDFDMAHIVDRFRYDDEFGGHIDADAVIDTINDMIKDDLLNEIAELLQDLPDDMKPPYAFLQGIDISVDGTSLLVEKYLRDDCDYEDHRIEEMWDNEVIDRIFNR